MKVGQKVIELQTNDVLTIMSINPEGMVQLDMPGKTGYIPTKFFFTFYRLFGDNECEQSGDGMHNFKIYRGFTEEYKYCVFCDKKEYT